MELNERKRNILRAIVEAYIERGEPVGSKYLTETAGVNLSSATIRNVMAELEQLNLLEQPHTSAGRVPSTLGYRVYVDSLMQSYMLTAGEIDHIKENLGAKLSDLNKLAEQASKLISSLTSLMSVSMTSKISACTISRFDAIPMGSGEFLLVLITSAGLVKTQYIRSERELEGDTLPALCRVFNENLQGVPPDEITLPLILRLKKGMGLYSFLVSPILNIIYDTVTEIDDARLYIDGITNLLKCPEYHDMSKAYEILRLVDEKEDLISLLSGSARDGLNVFIGDENRITTQGASSFLFKTFALGSQTLGVIGVIGPKRMDYSKSAATLEYLSEKMAEIIKLGSDMKDKRFAFYDDDTI